MVSEGLAAFVLERSDSSRTMVRSAARELLASCVLRNLMFYFTPYTLNKVLHSTAANETLLCQNIERHWPWLP